VIGLESGGDDTEGWRKRGKREVYKHPASPLKKKGMGKSGMRKGRGRRR